MPTLPNTNGQRPGLESLQDLVDAPSLRGQLRRIAGPTDQPVSSVTLIDEVEGLEAIESGTVVVLTESTSKELVNYRLDMALRLAGSSGAAGLIVTDGRDTIAATAETIAVRSGVAVLGVTAGVELTRLLFDIHRELTGGPEAALSRIVDVLGSLVDAEESRADTTKLLEVASAALGTTFEWRAPNPEDLAVPVVVDEDVDGHVCAPAPTGYLAEAAEVAAHLLAGAVSRARVAARRAEETPALSRGELLSEFLLSSADHSEQLLDRLRSVGVPIDWWHAVVRIEADRETGTAPADELASFQIRQRIGRLAFDAARTVPGSWQGAQVGPAFTLVRMERRDPGPAGAKDLETMAAEILRTINARLHGVSLVCGLGSVHQGPSGLRASAAEAHAAVAAARTARRSNVPVSFDGVGIQRTVIEWYAGDTARETVDRLLAPIDKLGKRKAEESIRTLQIYLDSQGSTARTAQLLHLHRNAVAYRMKRIFDLLEVDPEDSDTRLLLQLACRARFLRTG